MEDGVSFMEDKVSALSFGTTITKDELMELAL